MKPMTFLCAWVTLIFSPLVKAQSGDTLVS